MRVKFKDGTEKNCSNPTEQKIFKNGEAAGWVCSLIIADKMSSTDVDSVLEVENIKELTFCNDESVTLFSIIGYSKVTSAVVRHNESMGSIEIQLTKGV